VACFKALYQDSRGDTEKSAVNLSCSSLERYSYSDIDFTDAVLVLEVTLRSDFTLEGSDQTAWSRDRAWFSYRPRQLCAWCVQKGQGIAITTDHDRLRQDINTT
jgi:hypothetical protein